MAVTDPKPIAPRRHPRPPVYYVTLARTAKNADLYHPTPPYDDEVSP